MLFFKNIFVYFRTVFVLAKNVRFYISKCNEAEVAIELGGLYSTAKSFSWFNEARHNIYHSIEINFFCVDGRYFATYRVIQGVLYPRLYNCTTYWIYSTVAEYIQRANVTICSNEVILPPISEYFAEILCFSAVLGAHSANILLKFCAFLPFWGPTQTLVRNFVILVDTIMHFGLGRNYNLISCKKRCKWCVAYCPVLHTRNQKG